MQLGYVPLEDLIVPLKDLLRKAAALAVQLLPGSNIKPYDAVSAWLEKWGKNLSGVKKELGVDFLQKDGDDLRNLKASVERGQAGEEAGKEHCLTILRWVGLLPQQ